jgi:hypothetical protein
VQDCYASDNQHQKLEQIGHHAVALVLVDEQEQSRADKADDERSESKRSNSNYRETLTESDVSKPQAVAQPSASSSHSEALSENKGDAPPKKEYFLVAITRG